MAEKVYLIRESTLKEIGDSVRGKRGSADLIPVTSLAAEVSAIEDMASTYILEDEAGNEVPAVLVASETIFDATANDIRAGKTAVTDSGVVVGTKVIPSYHVAEGYQAIMPQSEFAITTLAALDQYDFTKLQALFCKYNKSVAQSVETDRVSIDGNVYAVNSADVISTVEIDAENKHIKFKITNNGDTPYILRYFTYKEIY